MTTVPDAADANGPSASDGPTGRLDPASWSLRARLIGVVAILLTVALTVAGALTVAALSNQLMSQVDADLVDAQKQIRDHGLAMTRAPDGPDGPDGRRRGPSTFVFAFRADDGTLAKPAGQQDTLPELPELSAASHPDTPFTVDGPNGRHWRVLAFDYRFSDYGDGVFLIGLPLANTEITVTSVLWRFAGLAVALIGLLGFVGYFAIGRAFRPLREVERVTEAFGEGDTSRRVETMPAGTEVGRLGSSVNQMLDQIETTLAAREASEQRMRRFVGDASHELRTPLSTVRGFAELYRMGAVSGPENISQTFRRIEDESTRMSSLVEDLLRLARLDEHRSLQLTSVDLLVLTADAEHDATALAPDRVVRMTGIDGSPHPAAALVTGDEQQLRQVVTNLMANALRHTPAGTPIELGVGQRGTDAIFQVVDHGLGVPPELAERIFERFFRADSSRSRGAGGGSGLGLAIVSSIVEAHRGTARVVPTPGGGATFEVVLPGRRAGHSSSGLSANSQASLSARPAGPA